MQIAGMIIEYNPMHSGHLSLLEETRRRLGADTAVIAVMSGNFVQRGDFALLRKHARARAAVESGVDLVLELPLPWAVSSAEGFARGAVETLAATGLVTHLAFGSECGDAAALRRLAGVLNTSAWQESLRVQLKRGVGFAEARQRAVAQCLPEEAALLATPNNILAVEYCRQLLLLGSPMEILTVARQGAGYHDTAPTEGHPSATLLRQLARQGQREEMLSRLPAAMAEAYIREEEAGRAPVLAENAERAILGRLRAMSSEELARLDEGGEGLYRRLQEAIREETSLEAILQRAKTRRYAYTRLRRMLLWAYLGLDPARFPAHPPYLRLLAANAQGRTLLARMRETAHLPVLTKPADVRQLSAQAQRLFAWEVRATDLYTLAYPSLSAARGGGEWREGPVIL